MDECVLLEDPEDGEILEEDISDVVTKDFMGVVIASYSSLVPQCAKLATIYSSRRKKTYTFFKRL